MLIRPVPQIVHRHLEIEGVRVFYRESIPVMEDAPTLLLLHGFPSGSHQFRRLFDVLGDRYRLIAPDYPGFGHTVASPDFVYSFETLSQVVERFMERLGLTKFVLYVFDFGAPVGLRLASRRPEWIRGLVVQNGNAYDEGLSEAAREFIALRPETPGAVSRIRELMTLSGTRGQYEAGVANLELVSPDGWTLDQHFLDLPGRIEAQVALAFDYRSNVESYPAWQRWLARHRPPTLITWGTEDPFFPSRGAHAYLRDLPDADLHLFPTGHFALEEHLTEIATLIGDFLDDVGS